jgi:hypothetical protein
MSIFAGEDPFWVAKRGTVTNGLVGHWDSMVMSAADRAGNRWLDISGNNNHGTLVGGASFDRIGCNFDGLDDYINTNTSLDFLGGSPSFTMSCWGQRRDTIVGAMHLGKRGGGNNYIHIQAFAGGTILFSIGGGFPSVSSNLTTWAHYAMTLSSSTIRGYINGVQVTSVGGPAALPTFTANYLIGNDQNRMTNGKMDDIRIYNRALSAAEILRNFNATRARFGV